LIALMIDVRRQDQPPKQPNPTRTRSQKDQ
jgi:hypothetical protein